MKIHSIHTLSETVSADKPIDAKNKFLNVGGGSSNTGVLLPRDVVESAKTASKSGDSEKESSVARITLYKNAITLNDEDKNFIDCSSEKGQRILKNLKAGIIPQEIEEKIQIRGRAAKVDIVDRTGVMLATEKQFSAFEGVSKLLSTGGGDEFEFPDEIKPRLLTPRGNACVVQIVSSAGKKCRVELGDANTVFELYCHTMKETGVNQPFQLIGGDPPRVVQEWFDSVGESNLRNCSLKQKIARH